LPEKHNATPVARRRDAISLGPGAAVIIVCLGGFAGMIAAGCTLIAGGDGWRALGFYALAGPVVTLGWAGLAAMRAPAAPPEWLHVEPARSRRPAHLGRSARHV
jgi:hypothetical protein